MGRSVQDLEHKALRILDTLFIWGSVREELRRNGVAPSVRRRRGQVLDIPDRRWMIVRGTVLYGPRNVRFEERPAPTIVEPTDALISLPVSCVCGSDLWPYRGIEPIDGPTPMGHEYVGIVEEVGSEVRLIEPGQFVVGSFSPRTTPARFAGPATSRRASTGSPVPPPAHRHSTPASRSP